MEAFNCPSCEASIDPADNFCRRCGAAVHRELPAVRSDPTPAVWQPNVSPVVRGAAVMAAGAMGQFVLRRLAANVFRGRPRKPRALQARKQRDDDGLSEEAQIITEMVMMRRVRLRRPE